MQDIIESIEQMGWKKISNDLHIKGYAQISNVLSSRHCKNLIKNYSLSEGYRKTVVMERHRFGLGEYKYYDYPLPDLVQTLREHIYPYLAPVANHWMSLLNIETRFSATLSGLHSECRSNHQHRPTPLILKYGPEGFNTLHQDLYGDVYFPLQAAVFLNEPDVDYSGGEFVLTQQVPRAQSKVMVLKPPRGSMVIFTTNFRPMKGSKGFCRATMRHGVSEISRGNRHTLGIIFHDAAS